MAFWHRARQQEGDNGTGAGGANGRFPKTRHHTHSGGFNQPKLHPHSHNLSFWLAHPDIPQREAVRPPTHARSNWGNAIWTEMHREYLRHAKNDLVSAQKVLGCNDGEPQSLMWAAIAAQSAVGRKLLRILQEYGQLDHHVPLYDMGVLDAAQAWLSGKGWKKQRECEMIFTRRELYFFSRSLPEFDMRRASTAIAESQGILAGLDRFATIGIRSDPKIQRDIDTALQLVGKCPRILPYDWAAPMCFEAAVRAIRAHVILKGRHLPQKVRMEHLLEIVRDGYPGHDIARRLPELYGISTAVLDSRCQRMRHADGGARSDSEWSNLEVEKAIGLLVLTQEFVLEVEGEGGAKKSITRK